MSRLPNLFDHRRLPVKLGKRLGAGGEGAVHALAEDPVRVAKVYFQALKPAQTAKLRAAVAAGNDALRNLCAWPEQVLADPIGATWGFVMPRVDGYRELHMLYSPGDRRAHFENCGYDFLVQAARNLAAAVGRVHEHGHVIGDLNQRNVLVNAQALVALIDCDSMQIRSAERIYRCPVGSPHLTAPELHGADFASQDRTPEHDHFALAILIFHLLMMGRHPYAGVWNGDDEMSIERAIRERRYAYAAGAASRFGMEPPRQAPPITIVGNVIAPMFERAFTGTPAERPDAGAWVQALDSLKATMRPCPVEIRHRFYSGLPNCPWCAMEEHGAYFFAPSRVHAELQFDPDALRRALVQIPPPQFEAVAPPVPEQLPPDPRLLDMGVIRLQLGVIGGVGSLIFAVILTTSLWPLAVLGFGALAIWARGLWHRLQEAKAECRCIVKRAEAALDAAVKAAAPDRFRVMFENQRAQLIGSLGRMQELKAEARNALAQLKLHNRELQLQEFLSGFAIKQAQLPHLDLDHKFKLAAHGIDTAADVDAQKILAIRGFGLQLTQELVDWRREREAQFQFDPKRGVPRLELDLLHARYHRRESELLIELRSGTAELKRYADTLKREQQKAKAALSALARERDQAMANARA